MINIRPINTEDLDSIVQLSHELGYPVSTEIVEQLIREIIEDEKQWAFVAVKENTIVGFVHAFYALRLTTPPFIEIAGLVVSEKERSQGIGHQLVQYVEQHLAQDRKVRVRCNSDRHDAHRFYLQNGYHKQKEQLVFVK
ncbi:MAG: GNAT family N-acetyltransferase [Flavobacteriales bacterium]|nr:GNAT family N-acetyltransferase [Flavobacteriales bacterium]